jgi:hypothetical protein
MAKAGRQTTKKRARQPRRQLRFALEEVVSKDKAAALKRGLAHEKTTLAAAREKAEQLDADRREIARYIAIRDNQMRPPWMDTPARRAKSKRRQEAERDYPYNDIRGVAVEALKIGTDEHRAWFYARVREMCRQHRPRIRTPANDRTMGRIIGDLYQNAERPEQKKHRFKR